MARAHQNRITGVNRQVLGGVEAEEGFQKYFIRSVSNFSDHILIGVLMQDVSYFICNIVLIFNIFKHNFSSFDLGVS
jgi:hypothetical protein